MSAEVSGIVPVAVPDLGQTREKRDYPYCEP